MRTAYRVKVHNDLEGCADISGKQISSLKVIP